MNQQHDRRSVSSAGQRRQHIAADSRWRPRRGLEARRGGVRHVSLTAGGQQALSRRSRQSSISAGTWNGALESCSCSRQPSGRAAHTRVMNACAGWRAARRRGGGATRRSAAPPACCRGRAAAFLLGERRGSELAVSECSITCSLYWRARQPVCWAVRRWPPRRRRRGVCHWMAGWRPARAPLPQSAARLRPRRAWHARRQAQARCCRRPWQLGTASEALQRRCCQRPLRYACRGRQCCHGLQNRASSGDHERRNS